MIIHSIPLTVLAERTALGQEIARDRAEDEPCERGTPGCCVHHTADGPCETW